MTVIELSHPSDRRQESPTGRAESPGIGPARLCNPAFLGWDSRPILLLWSFDPVFECPGQRRGYGWGTDLPGTDRPRRTVEGCRNHMNLISTRIKTTALLLPVAFSVAPAIATDCNGDGIEDDQETLIRAGDYAAAAELDAGDFAALASDFARPGEPAPDQQ